MESEDDSDAEESEESEDAGLSIAELSTTTTSRAEMTLEDRASMLQEHWEVLAWHADHARRLTRLEALDAVLPHLPDGPHALLLQQALLESEDLQATLRAVEQAARAMAHGMASCTQHVKS